MSFIRLRVLKPIVLLWTLLEPSYSLDVVVKKGSGFALDCSSDKGVCGWRKGEEVCALSGFERQKICLNGTLAAIEPEKCEFSVESFDSRSHSGVYECLGDEWKVFKVIEPVVSRVEIFGTLEMFERDTREISCLVRGGSPRPTAVKWTLSSNESKDTVWHDSLLPFKSISTFTIIADPNLDNQTLTCESVQRDSFGNVITKKYSKTIRIESPMSQYRSSNFKIVSRYPEASKGKTPVMILALGRRATFRCSASEPWHVCQWKSPISEEPCGIFSLDDPRDCRNLWGIKERNNSWFLSVTMTQRYSCEISGRITKDHEGTWNCEMQSKPYGSNDLYFHDQQYFKIETVRTPKINVKNFPEKMEITEDQTVDIEVGLKDGNPEPKIVWHLNDKPLNLEVIDHYESPKDGKIVKYRYKGTPLHSGKSLILKVLQEDDEGKEVSSKYESFLTVNYLPNPQTTTKLGGGIIAAIVTGTILSLLLCCILLAIFAVRRRRREEEPKSSKNTIIAVDHVGVGTDIPVREKLLGESIYSEIRDEKKIHKLPLLLHPDEIVVYRYEGDGSGAGSLSSLNSSEDEWIDERHFPNNHKFKHLSNILLDESGSSSSDIEFGESEV